MAGAGDKVQRIRTYLPQVLPSLEVMCRDNQAAVREKAVKALVDIGLGMTEGDMVGLFIPIVRRLAGNDLASARVSACTLLFVPYQTSSTSSKVEHHLAYAAFCSDVDAMVRREAASNLWRIAIVDYANFEQDAMSLLENLVQEDADESVRSAALQSCGALRDLIEPRVFVDHILPLIVAGSQDPSLRVREMAANQMQHLCEVEPGLPLPQVKTTRGIRIPLPSLQSFLGVIAVGTFVYGTYHGVSSLKQLVESIKTSGKEAVSQFHIARAFWTVKGCPALINVYPNVFWRQK